MAIWKEHAVESSYLSGLGQGQEVVVSPCSFLCRGCWPSRSADVRIDQIADRPLNPSFLSVDQHHKKWRQGVLRDLLTDIAHLVG